MAKLGTMPKFKEKAILELSRGVGLFIVSDHIKTTSQGSGIIKEKTHISLTLSPCSSIFRLDKCKTVFSSVAQ